MQIRFVVGASPEIKAKFVKQQIATLDFQVTLKDGSSPNAERWIEDAILKFRDADPTCRFAKALDEELAINSICKKFTTTAVMMYREKDQRAKDLSSLKEKGIEFKPENALALLQRDLQDIIEDSNEFASEHGACTCFRKAAAVDVENMRADDSTQAPPAKKPFDLHNPRLCDIEGSPSVQDQRFSHIMVNMLLKE